MALSILPTYPVSNNLEISRGTFLFTIVELDTWILYEK